MERKLIPLKICVLFGDGFLEKISVRISFLLVVVGLAGLYVEIINAFDYIQGARHGLYFFGISMTYESRAMTHKAIQNN